MATTSTPQQIWSISSKQCSACLLGDYSKCHCESDKSFNLRRDLSRDSLDQCDVEITPKKTSRFNTEYLSDNEFEEAVDFVTTNRPLPPSTTDWDTIDSVLSNELFEEHNENPSIEHQPFSSRMKHGMKNMQMVFVDTDESDVESIPDIEVYYDDHIDIIKSLSSSHSNLSCDNDRNIESRDSGYMTCDLFDVNIEKVTDNNYYNEPGEMIDASTRVLTSLKIHEEHELKKKNERDIQRQKEYDKSSEIHSKNIKELRNIKDEIEARIAQINMELVNELMLRDELYSHHESLLMDADDLAKSSPIQSENESTPKKTNKSQIDNNRKVKGFWKR